MKKNLAALGRGLLFVAGLACLLGLVMCVLSFKYEDGITTMENYYDLPADTVDVLMLGSSHIGMNVDTRQLWDDYGIAGYKCWASTQPIWNTYFYLKECLKTQTPKLVLLEVHSVSFGYDYGNYILQIKSTAGMRFSRNKLDAIAASAPAEDWPNLILGLPTYHTRYTELRKEDFTYFPWDRHTEIQTLPGSGDLVSPLTLLDPAAVEGSLPLTAKDEQYLRMILELCRDKGIPVELVAAPYALTEDEERRLRTVAPLAQEYGVPYTNYNDCYATIGIDPETDYRDTGHLNDAGIAKYTAALAEKLKASYPLPDRRTDAAHIWNRRAQMANDLLYRLPNQFVGDGKQNYLDTGLQLYANPLSSWSLLAEIEAPAPGAGDKVYFSCYDEAYGADNGLVFYGEENGGVTARFSGSVAVPLGNKRGTLKVGIVKDAKTLSLYLNGMPVNSTPLNSIDAYDGTLLLGCREGADGKKFRFSPVTVHALEVYDGTLAPAAVAAWSPEWPPMPETEKVTVSAGSAELKLKNRFVGDGTQSYVDTGRRLFADPAASWTLMAQFEPEISSGDSVYLSCFSEDIADYRGLLVRRVDDDLNILYGGGASFTMPLPQTGPVTLLVTKDRTLYTVYVNGEKVLDEVPSDCNAYDGTLLLGCERDAEGNLFRYSGVTVQNLWVVDNLVAEPELLAWAPAPAPDAAPDTGSSTAYTLPQSFSGNGTDLYVDTGVRLYDATQKSWTLHLQLDRSDTPVGTVLSCFAEDPTAYHGLMLRQMDAYTYSLTLGSAYTEITVPPAQLLAITIVRAEENYTVYVDGEPAATLTNRCATYNGPLMLGCERTLGGEAFRFGTARIRRLVITDGAGTQDDALAFWKEAK